MDVNRRQALQAGTAAAAAAPLLKSSPAAAAAADPKPAYAPYITAFDARGCSRKGNEYKGPKSGDYNDECCVKVVMLDVAYFYPVSSIPKYIQERQAKYGWKYQDLLLTGYNGLYKPLPKPSQATRGSDPLPEKQQMNI